MRRSSPPWRRATSDSCRIPLSRALHTTLAIGGKLPSAIRTTLAPRGRRTDSGMYLPETTKASRAFSTSRRSDSACLNLIRARATCRRRYQTTPATPAAAAATTRTDDSGSISTPLVSQRKNRSTRLNSLPRSVRSGRFRWHSHQTLSRGTGDRTVTVLPTVGARSRPRLGTRSRSELQLRFGVQPIENLTQTREVEQQCLPSRGLGYEFGIESRLGHEGEPDRAST